MLSGLLQVLDLAGMLASIRSGTVPTRAVAALDQAQASRLRVALAGSAARPGAGYVARNWRASRSDPSIAASLACARPRTNLRGKDARATSRA